MDQNLERKLLSVINRIGKDKTVIVVARRESSQGLCERVIKI